MGQPNSKSCALLVDGEQSHDEAPGSFVSSGSPSPPTSTSASELSPPPPAEPRLEKLPNSPRPSIQDFKSATTGVAAKAMRNELNKLSAAIEDPSYRKAFESEMQSFFLLFNRFLQEKARNVPL